jgi:hypothetical protein
MSISKAALQTIVLQTPAGMIMTIVRKTFAGIAIALVSQSVAAHELLMKYNLPVPFDLYLYACAATLVITFILLGWFMRGAGGPQSAAARVGVVRPIGHLPSWGVVLLRVGALACLGLTVVAGLIGTKDPDDNINLTLFWDVFLLGFTYATVLVGDVYAFANPWSTIVDLAGAGKSDSAPARFAYPESFGYWPALIFYIALIWLELFTIPGPRELSFVLIVYSVITFAGVWLFGKDAWFRHGELFGVFLRLVGMLAPLHYRRAQDGKTFEIRLRWPMTGVFDERPESMSLVVFVLFMLAGTTYDGMHQTLFWKGIFWHHLLPGLQALSSGTRVTEATMEQWYVVFQHIGLLLSPFFYLGVYLGILRLAKAVTKTAIPLRSIALALVLSILPIAFVYNLAHYYTLILVRSPILPYLFSDPFGYGWNPFHLPSLGVLPILNMAMVWHVEVALILVGHIVSVWLAHRIALMLFPSRREAIVSQMPMLLLMMSYTVLGLWVISLPFALT